MNPAQRKLKVPGFLNMQIMKVSGILTRFKNVCGFRIHQRGNIYSEPMSNGACLLSKNIEWYMVCIIKRFCFHIESLNYDKLKSGKEDDSSGSARPLS